jgi:hypothetical protein
MKAWREDGIEARALDDLMEGRSIEAYENAVLERVLYEVGKCYRLICRAVADGVAPVTAGDKISDDMHYLRCVLAARR